MNSINSNLESELSKGLKEVEVLLSEHIKGEYPLVVEISRHLVEAGGKRFRPMLTLVSSHFGSGQNRKVIEAAVVCELTHVATLYHDDVMDEAPLRRGVESANSRWGNSVAILTGDYLFSKASDLLADLGSEAVRLQAKTFERLVIGQIEETQGPRNFEEPFEHYLRVIGNKTGSLVATSLELGAMFSNTGRELQRSLAAFGENMGIAFQMVDDLCDIVSDSKVSGKLQGIDVLEGIPTIATLFLKNSTSTSDQQLYDMLQSSLKQENLSLVLDKLKNSNAILRAKNYVLKWIHKCRLQLNSLPNCQARETLDNICCELENRVNFENYYS